MTSKNTPYKMRDDKWGIRTEPPANYEKGEVVEVETKKGGAYRAVIRARIWGNDERELYAVDRLPDMKEDGNCPMCGRPLDPPEQPRHVKDTATQWQAASKRAEKPKANGPSQEFDDDIPF